MKDSEFLRRAADLRENVFVDKDRLDAVVTLWTDGKIDDAAGLEELSRLAGAAYSAPFQLSDEQVENEWLGLLDAMAEESAEWQRVAKIQFAQGFYILPATIVLVLAAILLAEWRIPGSAVAVGSICGACLTAVSAHAFFVLRVQQQARLAAERLSEKRAAVLFLRLAIGRSSAESAQLLAAGTAMFMGHHAAAAIPLQADDLRRKG